MAGKQSGWRTGQAGYQDEQTGERGEKADGDSNSTRNRQEIEMERDILRRGGTTSTQQTEKISCSTQMHKAYSTKSMN
jgi:hypothetical protein